MTLPEEKPCQQKSDSHTSVQMTHRIGALQIDVKFELKKPWTVLFGASGSGKTTILRAIAGLLRPKRGHIVCAGEKMLHTTAGIFVPVHRRRIRFAAQQPNLFPHRTVEESLFYSCDGETEDSTWEGLASSFGLEHVRDSLPKNISGGEAQRVNLARAVAAPNSRLLLLDEPFAGMDAARRDQLLPWLRDRLKEDGVPVLSVTHDVAEAFQLGAEVIKIADGKVMRQGPVETVLAEERVRLLAQLSGREKSPA